jgi:putative heme-binding domain-containing protein
MRAIFLAAASALLPPAAALQQKDPYADKPYWYKPGHPLEPADAAAVKTLDGFVAERILTVPKDMGSWTALAVDPRGRLIAAAQHQPGLYRITPAKIGDPASETKVERLRGTAEKIGWSHGLLFAFDSLYVTVSEAGSVRRGVHRLRDTDGDDRFDAMDLILPLEGEGEHGPHNLVVSPDGTSITMIAGNGTRPPPDLVRFRPVRTKGTDHLMPPGFDTTRHSVEGWACRFDPEGRNRELISSGLRNSFDLAYNRHGDLFTFDSDMEWDLGTPWYRPTRVCQLVSGGEFGWRKGTGIWPEYYPDSVRPVVNIGPASPTGLTYGYGTRYPARYQRALYVCDWTFATIHAVHLTPAGSGYEATVEEFAAGRGLPVTDAVVGADGAIYFVVGGRNLGSAVYRVRYAGSESTAPAEPVDVPGAADLRALRRRLEEFHGRQDAGAVEAAWRYMGHADHGIRFAARVAIEHQPVESWRERALAETDTDRKLTALLALARQGDEADQPAVIKSLGSIDFARSSDHRKIAILRSYELAFARGGSGARSLASQVAAALEKAFPDPDGLLSRELARLLCFLGAPDLVGRIVAMMEADAGQPETLGKSTYARNDKYGKAVADMLEAAPLVHRMHLAQMLIWARQGWTSELRTRYFQLIADGMAHSKGGYGYRDFWVRTRKHALEAVPAALRERMEAISAGDRVEIDRSKLPKARGPGREWTTEAVLAELKDGLKNRNYESGRTMYAAASCIVCHRVGREGGTVGPRLIGLGGRFTLRDIVEAVVEPGKAVSDQYRMVQIRKTDGSVIVGRVNFLESGTYHLMPDMMSPGQTVTVRPAEIDRVKTVESSPMPTRLLDPLSRDELLDLMAYLVSEGDPDHAVFQR